MPGGKEPNIRPKRPSQALELGLVAAQLQRLSEHLSYAGRGGTDEPYVDYHELVRRLAPLLGAPTPALTLASPAPSAQAAQAAAQAAGAETPPHRAQEMTARVRELVLHMMSEEAAAAASIQKTWRGHMARMEFQAVVAAVRKQLYLEAQISAAEQQLASLRLDFARTTNLKQDMLAGSPKLTQMRGMKRELERLKARHGIDSKSFFAQRPSKPKNWHWRSLCTFRVSRLTRPTRAKKEEAPHPRPKDVIQSDWDPPARAPYRPSSRPSSRRGEAWHSKLKQTNCCGRPSASSTWRRTARRSGIGIGRRRAAGAVCAKSRAAASWGRAWTGEKIHSR